MDKLSARVRRQGGRWVQCQGKVSPRFMKENDLFEFFLGTVPSLNTFQLPA